MPALRCVVVTIVVLGCLLGGCAGPGATGGFGGSGLVVSGDDRGGQIPNAVGGSKTTEAMSLVTAHCAKYGKKAFITKMQSPDEGGLIAFECLEQRGKKS